MYDFIKWFRKYNLPAHRLYFNIIWQPDYLSIKNMSTPAKQKIKEFLYSNQLNHKELDNIVNEVIDFMFTTGEDLEQNFLEHANSLDNVRNENFSKTFNELYKILEKDL
jgi:hypothetical protein